ncbi:MAG: PAS domain S-box protein [Chloroflexota bacterium]
MIGAMLAAAHLLLPTPGIPSAVHTVSGAVGAIAVVLGIRIHRPESARPWILMAAALGLWFVGDVVYAALAAGGDSPHPSATDIGHVVGSGLLVVALFAMVRGRDPGDPHALLLDASIVGITAGLLGWVLFGASSDATTMAPLESLVALFYPAVDLVLLALALRLAVLPGHRPTALWLLVGGILMYAVADTVFATLIVQQAYSIGATVDAALMLGAVLFGAAALHPSMTTLVMRVPIPSERLEGRRLIPVSLAVLAAATTLSLAWATDVVRPGAVAVAAIVALVALGLARGGAVVVRLQQSIREVERTRDALAAQRHELTEAQRIAHLGSWDWDLVTDGLTMSPTMCAIVGVDPAAAPNTGTAFYDIVHPDDRDSSRRAEEVAFSTGEPYRAEYRIVRLDGSARVVEDRAEITHDSDGRPIRMLGIAIDITERRETEAARDQLAAAVEQTTDTIVITDLESRIVYVNAAMERRVGYPREALIGQNSSIVTGLPASEDNAIVRAAMESPGGLRQVVPSRHADGTIGEEEVTITPVRNGGGHVVGAVGVGRDVTHERVLEAQVRQAQKMEAVGTMAAGIAHDFNNVLTAITGYAQLLLEGLPEGASERDDLDQILAGANRASTLTRQLLTFAKRQPADMHAVDAGQLVRDLERLIGRLIGVGIELDTVVDDAILPVRADPGQIEQVVMNLAANARDAMPDGGQLRISARTVEIGVDDPDAAVAVPGSWVEIAVLDTGTGMTADVLSHVFEPYYTTKRATGGSGLGLATAYGIVRAHGGHMLVDTTPGVGTTFRVLLPPTDEPTDSAVAESSVPHAGTGQTVLLVEDDDVVRRLAVRLLEALGFTVIETSTPALAIDIATDPAQPLDVLLTDVRMPLMGGTELAARIREARPTLPVVLMSGYSEESLGDLVRAEPGYAFLGKPFTREQLGAVLHDALEG